MRANLRAVDPDEKPKPAEITSVETAAEHGTRLDELRQMRRVIARALDSERTSPRDLAALSRRQMEISREIEAYERQAEEEAEEGQISEDEDWTEDAI